MALVLTFLGKGGVGRTTVAIAAARRYAQQGKRVLLASQDCSPALGMMLEDLGAELSLGPVPSPLAPNLQVVQLHTAHLLEQAWDELKKLESQYLRTPFFKNVYGQELGLFPGLDSALALNAIRQYGSSEQFDIIVFDGHSSPETLRMLGMPEIISWYARRFRQVFTESDLGRTLSPFMVPVAAAVLNVNWAADNFAAPNTEMDNLLDRGKAAIADPSQTVAYLVTTADRASIATSQYLWGSAQQVGLTVGGVLVRHCDQDLTESFKSLSVTGLPVKSDGSPESWQPLMDAMPNLEAAVNAPRAVTIDTAARQVSLFLPSFTKQQVKLSQSGPEITIEAGDQRRNVFLPPQLSGLPVSGAKFQEGYLIISF
jgi:anion-transporting  ArsA/GET3 family ATPase